MLARFEQLLINCTSKSMINVHCVFKKHREPVNHICVIRSSRHNTSNYYQDKRVKIYHSIIGNIIQKLKQNIELLKRQAALFCKRNMSWNIHIARISCVVLLFDIAHPSYNLLIICLISFFFLLVDGWLSDTPITQLWAFQESISICAHQEVQTLTWNLKYLQTDQTRLGLQYASFELYMLYEHCQSHSIL